MRRAEVARLLAWFARHRRVLPWRRHRTPYRVLVSEFLLQQTRAGQAAPYFERFMRRFPSLEALARAPRSAVLKAWEGLGYYARARRLHEAARVIVRVHGGRVPESEEALRALPGVGAYTAAAVASLAFNRAVVVVDGNVERVGARFFALEGEAGSVSLRARVRAALERALPAAAGAFNEALMELGATVCTPRAPVCSACPLARGCRARALDAVARFPVPRKKRRLPLRVFAALWARRGEHVLLARNPQEGFLGGLWGLPLVPMAPGESMEALAARFASAGVRADLAGPVARVRHTYTHFRQRVEVFEARPPVRARRGRYAWLSVARLKEVALARVHQKALQALAVPFSR